MVYRLTTMTKKTKVIVICLVWLLSAACATVGTLLIATCFVLPQTPYDIQTSGLISEIRQDMGPFQNLAYYDHITDNYYWNVALQEDGETIQIYDFSGGKIGNLDPVGIEEHHTNGSIFYDSNSQLLIFDLFNGTFYEIKTKSENVRIDVSNLVRPRITLSYQPGENFKIQKRTIETTGMGDDERNIIPAGEYFIVRNRGWISWVGQMFVSLWENSLEAFLMIGSQLLVFVAIGGGAGIITAFFLILTRLTRVFGGKRITFIILRALNGRVGRILSYIPVFDFVGDFFVEERLVNVIDFSGIRSTLSELYKQRWYDILFFPTALASIITIIFVQLWPGEDKGLALLFSPLLTPIALVFILVYFPSIFAFNEGGFKRMQVSPQGDIVAVKPVGNILRDGLGIIIGFSGILSLGALAMEVTTDFSRKTTTTEQLQVAGFSVDVFSILLLVLWTLGLFFVLLGSTIVGSSLLAIHYLESSHLDTIEYLRTKAEEQDVVINWGSLNHQFSPVPTKAIFEKKKA